MPPREFGDSAGRDSSSGPPRAGDAAGRRPRGAGGGRPFRRKACRFCVAQTDRVDYKNVALL
ncbi:MAG: 30S ribosomal protein S18, partial [bacterium]